MKALTKPTGFLGPEGTFSHQAALQAADESVLRAFPTIYAIFDAVANDEVEYGVVPAENSTEGTIRETLDYLLDLGLFTCGSVELRIHQNLLSRENSLDAITKVVSHPQALAQCRVYLHTHLPKAHQTSANSTVAPIETHAAEDGVGFICSKVAADIYSINVLAEQIEDVSNNSTRFYIISKKPQPPVTVVSKTLLCISASNRVGMLRDILDVLANAGINLSKLESRPNKIDSWEYNFFIEVDVLESDPPFEQAITILKPMCSTITIMGSV